MDKIYRERNITVYSPTFNRGYCLHQLYESLLRQTSQNFESLRLFIMVYDGVSKRISLTKTYLFKNQYAVLVSIMLAYFGFTFFMNVIVYG